MRWALLGLVVAIVGLLWVVMTRETSRPADHDARLMTFGPGGQQVSGRLFSGARVSGRPRLVVVIHGDAPGHDPAYQYDFARTLAADLDDTLVLAVLRPGYRDGMGAGSDGDRGLAVGDNYTEDAAEQLGAAVAEAATRLHARDVRVVGHSGGAALALIMLARRPGLASGALVASCPCDLGPWRRHMALRGLNPFFLLPVRSVSPLAKVDRLPAGLDLRIMVGQQDLIAPVWLSERLLRAASARGLHAQLTVIPDAGHEILENPAVIAAALDLAVSGR